MPSTYRQLASTPVGLPFTAGTVSTRVAIACTPRMMYRVHNVSVPTQNEPEISLNVYSAASGTALNSTPIKIGDFFDVGELTPLGQGYTENTLYFGTSTSGTLASVILEPLVTARQSGRFRSPLTFVLKATDDVFARKLIGTFYGANGQELVSRASSPLATISMPISASTSKTLGKLFLENGGGGSNELLLADAYEFRGVLYGGAVDVVPGSNNANPGTVDATYAPTAGATRLYPGQVVLSGASGAWQPAQSPGFFGPPLEELDISLAASATSTKRVDSAGGTIGRLFVRATGESDVQIEVLPCYAVMGSSTYYTSDTLVYQTDYSFNAAGVFHFDLDPGIHDIKIKNMGTATATFKLACQWL